MKDSYIKQRPYYSELVLRVKLRYNTDMSSTSEVDLLPKGVTIRDFTSGDTEALVKIAKEAWMPIFVSFREILGDDLYTAVFPDWKQEKENQIRSATATESPVRFIVAEADATIVGFASYVMFSKSGNAEIGNNAVLPAYQGRGIARALYRIIIRRARDSGAATLRVTTGLDPSHAPARSAYERAGFQQGIPMVTYYMKL